MNNQTVNQTVSKSGANGNFVTQTQTISNESLRPRSGRYEYLILMEHVREELQKQVQEHLDKGWVNESFCIAKCCRPGSELPQVEDIAYCQTMIRRLPD